MEVKVKRLDPDAIMPSYSSAGAAAFDLRALEAGYIYLGGAVCKARTGLAFEIPQGHVMLIVPRSGLGTQGLTLKNTIGVIDSDYRGEVIVPLQWEPNPDADVRRIYHWNAGDRVAQALIVPVAQVSLTEAETLTDTDRGTGGFGSTGVR